MSRYSKLYELKAYHLYTGDTPCSELRFSLDASSRFFFNRAGLIQTDEAGSIDVYRDVNRSEVIEASITEGSATFAWRLFGSKPSIASCTWPQLMQPGQTLLLESRDGRSPEMHDGEFVEQQDFVNLTDEALPELLALKNRGDEAAEAKLVDMLGVELASLLTPRDLLLPPLAFVILHLYSLEPSRHHIRLKSLSTYWRYRVFGEHADEGMRVIDVDGKVTFESLGNLEIAGGRSARSFVSNEPLPLQAQGGPRLELHPDSTNGRNALARRLPIASAANTRRERFGNESKERYVSDIFVNL